MTSRKKFGAAFWGMVVLVCVLVYLIGFGPSVWLAARGAIPETAVKCVYWPLLCQRAHLQKLVGNLHRLVRIPRSFEPPICRLDGRGP